MVFTHVCPWRMRTASDGLLPFPCQSSGNSWVSGNFRSLCKLICSGHWREHSRSRSFGCFFLLVNSELNNYRGVDSLTCDGPCQSIFEVRLSGSRGVNWLALFHFVEWSLSCIFHAVFEGACFSFHGLMSLIFFLCALCLQYLCQHYSFKERLRVPHREVSGATLFVLA